MNLNEKSNSEDNMVQKTQSKAQGIAGSTSVVACIPAFNEENTIARMIVQVGKYVDIIVVCDDGSSDLTFEIAQALGVVVLRHDKNLGKGAALKTVFRYTAELKPDVIVVIDADGQHDPGEIPMLLEPIVNQEKDFVVGSRYLDGSRNDAPFYRRVGLRFFNFLGSNRKTSQVLDTQSGFRAMSGDALKIMLNCDVDGYGVETEQLKLAFDHGLRVGQVPIKTKYSGLGKTSKKHPLLHGSEIFSTILRLIVEERPLSVLGLPGLLITIFGASFGMYFLLLFNKTRYFSIPMAVITTGALLLGTLLIITSLVLYALTRIKSISNARVNNQSRA